MFPLPSLMTREGMIQSDGSTTNLVGTCSLPWFMAMAMWPFLLKRPTVELPWHTGYDHRKHGLVCTSLKWTDPHIWFGQGLGSEQFVDEKIMAIFASPLKIFQSTSLLFRKPQEFTASSKIQVPWGMRTTTGF